MHIYIYIYVHTHTRACTHYSSSFPLSNEGYAEAKHYVITLASTGAGPPDLGVRLRIDGSQEPQVGFSPQLLEFRLEEIPDCGCFAGSTIGIAKHAKCRT